MKLGERGRLAGHAAGSATGSADRSGLKASVGIKSDVKAT